MASSPLRMHLPTSSKVAGKLRTNLRWPSSTGLQCQCFSAINTSGQADRSLGELQTLFIERYGDGRAKRYVVDSQSRLGTVLEDNVAVAGRLENSEGVVWIDRIPSFVKDFVLPAGFPGSVSEDYLDYMLLLFPTNMTNWICRTLVTSSLLKAAGIGSFSSMDAAASAAAIRWVLKDGLGAVGRLLIGGRFGNIFDDDPKKWRMFAGFIGNVGSILELATPLAPSYFLLLASLGNLTKAIAGGLKDPSVRVIQNHFAASENLGEIAAKEEVWEVAAQLIGLAIGILIIDLPGLQTSYPTLVATWLGVRHLHLWLRYQSVLTLRFKTINLKRARILVKSHVQNSVVPDYVECSKVEKILSWEINAKPRIFFGTPIEDMIEGNNKACSLARELLELYMKEKYILVVKANPLTQELEFHVSFKVGATGLSVLRSVWQAYWLSVHCTGSNDQHAKLEQSLLILNEKFSEFMLLLDEGKWDTRQINIKVPKDLTIESVMDS